MATVRVASVPDEPDQRASIITDIAKIRYNTALYRTHDQLIIDCKLESKCVYQCTV